MGSIDACNGAVFDALAALEHIHITHDHGVKFKRPGYLDEVRQQIEGLSTLCDKARAALTHDVVESFARGRHEIMGDYHKVRWLDQQYATCHEAAVAFVGEFCERGSNITNIDAWLKIYGLWDLGKFKVGIETEAAAAREAAATEPETVHWLEPSVVVQMLFDMRSRIASDHGDEYALDYKACESAVSKSKNLRSVGERSTRRYEPASATEFISQEEKKILDRIDKVCIDKKRKTPLANANRANIRVKETPWHRPM